MSAKSRLTLLLLASTALSQAGTLRAAELPQGPSVASGSVSVASPSASTMTINQGTANAIVNWQSFSVGQGSRVDIQQPSSSSTLLNRVTGSTTSTIAGQVNANGQVFLVNPNGILITPTGAVNAGGGFVASTLDIADGDFIAGKRTFRGNGSSKGVTNQGAISIGQGGYAALIGGTVENSGTVSVPLGKVGLGAGEQVTIDPSGDGFLQVAVPSTGIPADKDLVVQSGRIAAPGGRVEMKAATARALARSAINVSGVVEATTVSGRSGAIVLGGGDGGAVSVSGKLLATAPRGSRAKGGAITITGQTIALKGATLDASGDAGGGTIRVGGDVKGTGTLARAETTSVDPATTIRADAGDSGDGGSIVIWSDRYTTFAGSVFARGGATMGDGGQAEVSSKGVLAFGGSADLRAPAGRTGTLLLDPYDVVIGTAPTSNNSGAPGFTPGPGPSTTSYIDVATLVSALSSASVTISTGSDPAVAGAGDITLAAPLAWSSGNGLSLQAARDIILSAALSGPNGTLTLDAGRTITATAPVTVQTFQLNAGNWVQNAGGSGSLPAFSASDFQVAFGSGASFLRVLGGDGLPGSPFLVADVYGLQGIASTASLGSAFALAGSIDASGTAAWYDFEGGFVPIGSSSNPFTGSFNGNGYTIANLFVGGGSQAGLFGASQGSIANVVLARANVSGGADTGGLVGLNGPVGIIQNASVSGSITGFGSNVGGLVGRNLGLIETSAATAGSPGLVTTSFGTDNVGGLVGTNGGQIVNSYATIAVSGLPSSGSPSLNVGGLVGFAGPGSSIVNTYAAGPVAGSGPTVGGLVGGNGGGAVVASFWDPSATGQAISAGGVALTTAQFQDTLGFVSIAGPQGWDFRNVWAPGAPGRYPSLYALGGTPGFLGPGLLSSPAALPLLQQIDQLNAPRVLQANILLNNDYRALPLTWDVPDELLGELFNGGTGGGSGGSGGGPTLGTGQATTTLETAKATLSYIERSSGTLEQKLAECERVVGKSTGAYAACVGDALTAFASALDERVVELPPPLRGISAVIREAAARVRSARTVGEARAAVHDALSAVRKAIALIRADDPAVAKVQLRQGTTIRTALQRCDFRLAQAGGL